MTPSLLASNLEQVTGSFDVVTCLDVVIHYDDDKVIDMIKHLAGMAEKKLIISFAPKTPFLSFLKSVGEFFPGKFSCPPHPLPSFADCADSLSLVSFLLLWLFPYSCRVSQGDPGLPSLGGGCQGGARELWLQGHQARHDFHFLLLLHYL